LVFAILFGSSSSLVAETQSSIFDGTQSGWAEEELIEAYNLDLTYPGVMNSYRKNITREEFCILAVRLYEALSGNQAMGGVNPFQDTKNEDIVKAFHLGIVKGVSATEFAPYKDITRQEICVMIHRTLKVALTGIQESYTGEFPFSDQNQIASWAMDSVRFAYGNGIMKGIGSNLIGPLQNTTREQAIVLMKRTYVSFKDGEPQGPILQNPGILLPEDNSGIISTYSNILNLTNPLENFRAMEGGNLFFPQYDDRIDLYVATGEAKPLGKPSTGSLILQPININLMATEVQKNVYTDSTMTAFVDREGESKRWFYFNLNDAAAATKVVWQVSQVQFNGFETNWKSPVGLLASGEVGAGTKEFQIDFSSIKLASTDDIIKVALNTSLINTNLINTDIIKTDTINTDLIKPTTINLDALKLKTGYKPITSNRSVYYVRAIPIDSLGKPIGDPGKGIAVIYGERIPEVNFDGKISADFQLWTPVASGGIVGGEYPNYPEFRPIFRVEPRLENNRLFHFNGIDPSVERIVLQFSTEKFPTTGGAWPNTPNIIHEVEYDLPVPFVHSNYPNTVMVDIAKFAKPVNEMKEGDAIKYYVRGVTLKPSIIPGEYQVKYSSPLTMEYEFGKPVTYYSDNPYKYVTKLPYSLPDISIKEYVKPRWPDKNYMEHYYVYRAPKWNEIQSKFKNSQTGEILYPYMTHIAYYKDKGIDTPEEYEKEMIPRVLALNTKVHIPKPEDKDEAWYQQLFAGVVNFFKDLAGVIKTIVNQVSDAYARLKNKLIMSIVNIFPLGEPFKAYFKATLEAWANYGLMWLGIPPTLPNFDQLAEMSMDYYVQVVLTETGIPQNDWTEQLVEDITVEMGKQLDQAANYADKNPIDAPFLKLDPDYMYRPAYVDLEISNPTEKPTVPGMIETNVTFEFGYYDIVNPATGLYLEFPSHYAYSSDAAWQNRTTYVNHFEKGLNGYTVNYAQGYNAVYDVFIPMKEVKVPSLRKGDSTKMRVYLEPFKEGGFTRYPGAEGVSYVDFENMYFNNGNKNLTYFNIRGVFPTAEELYLKGEGIFYLDPETQYVYFNESKAPKTSERLQKPVSVDWKK